MFFFLVFSHKRRCQKIEKPKADFDRTLIVAVGVVSVRGSGQILMQISGCDLIFRGSHLTNIPGVAQITAEESRIENTVTMSQHRTHWSLMEERRL